MSTKKIALFGDGQMMRRVAEDALRRGHIVTAVVRFTNEFKMMHPRLKIVSGDIMNRSEVSKYARGNEVLICVHEPSLSRPQRHVEANRAIIQGSKNAGIERIISFGYPISIKLESSKEFYQLWKPVAEAQGETLKLFKNIQGLQWGYMHSIELGSSKNISQYSISNEIVLSTPDGRSKVVIDQLVKTILDEAEKRVYIWEVSETHL